MNKNNNKINIGGVAAAITVVGLTGYIFGIGFKLGMNTVKYFSKKINKKNNSNNDNDDDDEVYMKFIKEI